MIRNILHVFALLFLPAALMADEEIGLDKLNPINHIIIFYLENHSFDNIFGTYGGADGFMQAGNKLIQTDENDEPYTYLPQVKNGKEIDVRFSGMLSNGPFLIDKYVSQNQKTGNLVHRFYQLQAQMNGGKMDKFVAAGDSGGLPMGFYNTKDSPIWRYAKKYTLADHFFTAAFGGSFVNHMELICACVPRYEGAPEELRSKLDENGALLKDAALTPDGYAVNTIKPYTKDARQPEMLLPLQTMPTIGDRLSEKNIGWAWYAGGWQDAENGMPDKTFHIHHQPFAYFKNYAEGTDARKQHLKDEKDFIKAIEKGDLPAVSFYKPLGEFDLHPGYSDMQNSEAHVFSIIQKIEKSGIWKDTLIIVTFDDAGGFYDHVMPPKVDRFGPGERVPTLIISPFAKHLFVDHTVYDTTSILKLIEKKYNLEPLTDRDAKAKNILNSLN